MPFHLSSCLIVRMQSTNPIRVERWFYIFLAAHFLCWTLVPALIRYNLPLDAIEGTTWGHQLEWGYDKNPYLNGWLTALAVHLDGQTGMLVYLFSQLSVIACFWAVWQLAKRMLTPAYALISVLLLEGIQYYNFHAIDFNDNTLELGLWGLAIYFFYFACRSNSIRWWMLTGLFAGFGMMAKYYTAALLASMVIFLLGDKKTRRLLKTWPPYIGLLALFSVILPHVIWLFYHDFITVTYVFARAASTPSWTNHFFFPAQFAWQQLEVLFPALLLAALLFIGKKPLLNHDRIRLTSFNQAFLFYVGLGPFLLTILLSIFLGINLRAGWGMPLLSLWGIILMALIQPRLTKAKLTGFVTVIFTLMGILLTGYSVSLISSDSPSSANFPGREIAAVITQHWHDQYHTKLEYVAGSRWVGGNIGFYSSDHPAVFIEWNHQHAPWIDIRSLREKGAVFVWDITDHETMPADIQKQFPHLSKPIVLEFNWQRNRHHIPPIKVGMAVLAPVAAK